MSRLRHAQRRGNPCRGEQQPRSRPAALNLVSLMDIFTILVFFLMVNSSEVEVLQNHASIELPASIAEQQPDNRLVISVSHDDLVVQGRRVARVAELTDTADPLIPGLQRELAHQAGRHGGIPPGGHEITIIGDHELPYWLLKKIMHTCQTEQFARISLAVERILVEA